MRRRDPDALTTREREVLALIRVGLTNEEIARRLGMTLDGAKYHVSQILSKLGVATREEAASWRPEERRAWWARWPVWAKIAGTATLAAAAAGLAVLAWGVLRTGSEPKDDDGLSGLTVEGFYARVQEAIDRPGFVLRSTVRTEIMGNDRASHSGVELVSGDHDRSRASESWIDVEGQTMRTYSGSAGDSGAEGRLLFIGEQLYAYGNTRPQQTRTWVGDCHGPADARITIFLCAYAGLDDASLPTPRIDGEATFAGQPAVALVFESTSFVELTSDGRRPPVTEPAKNPIELRYVVRFYFARDSFLPLARVGESYENGAKWRETVAVYDNEFARKDDLPEELFDRNSLNYVPEETRARLQGR